MWSACDLSLPGATCGLVRRVLLALMVCARSALADEPALASPAFGGVRELAGLRELLCPPEFLSLDAGRRLEAHATPCADTELQPEAGRGAAAPVADQASAMATEVGSNPEAPPAYPDAGSQYFFKLRGIRSIRLGARFSF